MELSKGLILKLLKEGKLGTVLKYMFESIRRKLNYSYQINKAKRVSVVLHNWLKYQVNSDTLKEKAKELKGKSYKQTVLNILKFVNGHVEYIGDVESKKMVEHWSRAIDTYKDKIGDCEDGAILMYILGNLCGIPDHRFHIAAGNVVGGGHCYCIFVDDDGLEYPIDWCYWYSKSKTMKVPYHMRYEYYQGQKEWFRTSISGTYKDLQ